MDLDLSFTTAAGLGTSAIVVTSIIRRYFYRKEWKFYREIGWGTMVVFIVIFAVLGYLTGPDVPADDRISLFKEAVMWGFMQYAIIGKRADGWVDAFMANRSSDGGNND